MLYEIVKIKQNKGEPKRRWFIDDYFDLVLWQNESNGIVGFQLCYDRTRDMHALTWYEDSGFMHNRIDDGENKPGKYKSIPVLLPNGHFPSKTIAEKFKAESAEIDPRLSEFIYRKILEL